MPPLPAVTFCGLDPASAWPAGAAPATEMVRWLRSGAVSPRELLLHHLARIEKRPELNAFLFSDPERLLALGSDAAPGPLFGLPVAVKDNIDTEGIPTTAGSLAFAGRVPGADAACWRRLRRAGAVLLGKTHLSEFAYRSHHPALARVLNPHDLERASGGSSSGSAVAVAAHLAPVALGTDTGGSVRVPAAYCGVVGLKGSLGSVSTQGVVPLSRTLDHVGVLARSVSDAALVYRSLCLRPLRVPLDPRLQVVPEKAAGLKVGVVAGFPGRGVQMAVKRALEEAADRLDGAGCQVSEIKLAAAGRWRWQHSRILLYEAFDFHRLRLSAGAPYGEVFRQAMGQASRISQGTYRSALSGRQAAKFELEQVFSRVHLLLLPTCPTIAPRGDAGVRSVDYTRYTTLAAFAGLPAITLPAGRGRSGMPVAVQLVGRSRDDARLIQAAALLERLLLGS